MMNHTDVTVSADNLAKIIKAVEANKALSPDQGEALSSLFDDLRLQVQKESNMSNRQYYDWLDTQ